MRAQSGWIRARLYQGKPRLGQGTVGGADARHEQGSTAAGAHGKARARQTQVRQWAAVLEQGAAAGGAWLGTWARALLAVRRQKGGEGMKMNGTPPPPPPPPLFSFYKADLGSRKATGPISLQ